VIWFDPQPVPANAAATGSHVEYEDGASEFVEEAQRSRLAASERGSSAGGGSGWFCIVLVRRTTWLAASRYGRAVYTGR
jgi:hypothetical protein